MSNRVLIINGSPRKNKSTSLVFAEAFAAQYKKLGGEVIILDSRKPLKTQEEILAFETEINKADVLGLFFPLYVDSLPSNLLETLYYVEKLLSQRKIDKKAPMKIFGTTQCGYPITSNMQYAVENCKLFATSVDAEWLGCLSYGGGSMINGKPLDQLGKKGVVLNRVFENMAKAVIQGTSIPKEVLQPVHQSINFLLLPFVKIVLNFIFRRIEKKTGKDMSARPCQNIQFEWE